VCASDWSGIFSELARGIASRVTSWPLSQRPRVDTIQVFLTEPGRPERALATGWTYDPTTNRITLSPETIPMVGSVVRVTYRTPELSP
jgi:hypothetical protein